MITEDVVVWPSRVRRAVVRGDVVVVYGLVEGPVGLVGTVGTVGLVGLVGRFDGSVGLEEASGGEVASEGHRRLPCVRRRSWHTSGRVDTRRHSSGGWRWPRGDGGTTVCDRVPN